MMAASLSPYNIPPAYFGWLGDAERVSVGAGTAKIGQGGLRPEEIELHDLWSRRAELAEREWARLWAVVWLGLGRYRPSILGSINDSFEDLFADFFLQKVREPRLFHSNPPDHFGALCLYFSRFLIDRQRAEKMFQEFDDERDGAGAEAEVPSACVQASAVFGVGIIGLDEAMVRVAAIEFFGGLPEWARLYLSLSICPDGENQEALYKLSARLNIASHHYKAKQLGVTRGKGKSLAGYEDTLIGGWISRQLRIPIDREHQDYIGAALAVLCYVALQVVTAERSLYA